MDIFNYHRRKTQEVYVGGVPLGGNNPIRLQSMTTLSTDDTLGCVQQAIRIFKAGGEYVRLTTQGSLEAENLGIIKKELLSLGYKIPLIADVHFNAKIADVAAEYADKVRINPGNYLDKARKFETIEYSNEEYLEEINKIHKRFSKFLSLCKKNHVAIRIGVNHGSLSDRIMSRYGNTPEGIVESCMEFLRICKKENFLDVVVSIKSSNTQVMVSSVRLLTFQMDQENMNYPIHLGVTEAGDGEDGRIKSAVGIGALLSDGIGDTIRVSLSEEPEKEIPVAFHIVSYIKKKENHPQILGKVAESFSFLKMERRCTREVENIGGKNPPIVISSRKTSFEDLEIDSSNGAIPDYIYCGEHLPKKRNPLLKYILEFEAYTKLQNKENVYPLFYAKDILCIDKESSSLKFLKFCFKDNLEQIMPQLMAHPEVVAVIAGNNSNRLAELRFIAHTMMLKGIKNPIVFCQEYCHSFDEKEEFLLEASVDMGALMFDGLTDGIWLTNSRDIPSKDIEQTSFGILQAARLRISKTEYISCPGCGRTLYDLKSTIARIKKATKDLKGLKIGIMGCIVNGPGEMADADYGYVGAARGKVSLYRGKQCVEKNIPELQAVEKLLELIRNDKKG